MNMMWKLTYKPDTSINTLCASMYDAVIWINTVIIPKETDVGEIRYVDFVRTYHSKKVDEDTLQTFLEISQVPSEDVVVEVIDGVSISSSSKDIMKSTELTKESTTNTIETELAKETLESTTTTIETAIETELAKETLESTTTTIETAIETELAKETTVELLDEIISSDEGVSDEPPRPRRRTQTVKKVTAQPERKINTRSQSHRQQSSSSTSTNNSNNDDNNNKNNKFRVSTAENNEVQVKKNKFRVIKKKIILNK